MGHDIVPDIAAGIIPLRRVQMAIGIGRREFVATRGSAALLAWPLASRAQPAKTNVRRLLGLSAAALAASTIACSAGPCSPEIGRMQARLDATFDQRPKAPAHFSTVSRHRALLHLLKSDLAKYHQRRRRLSGKRWPERAKQTKPATRQLASKRSRRFNAR